MGKVMAEFYVDTKGLLACTDGFDRIIRKCEEYIEQLNAVNHSEALQGVAYEASRKVLHENTQKLQEYQNEFVVMKRVLIEICELYERTERVSPYQPLEALMTCTQSDKSEQELEKWLSPDYKLTGKDKEKAEKMLEDYFAKGTKARNLRDIRNPNYGMVIRSSMSEEELQEYQKMIALSNKLGVLSGFAEGVLGGIPFLHTMGDKLSEYIMESERHTLLDVSKGDTMYANSLKQHGIATIAGTLTANIALWEIGTKAVKWGAKGAGGNTTSIREQLLDSVSNDKLKNCINEMYRLGATTGDGGLADAIRHELTTGELVGGKSHITKGLERVKNLENIIAKQGLSNADLKIAIDLLDNLKAALELGGY